MNDIELMRICKPDLAPSPDTVARHRRELIRSIEAGAARSSEQVAGLDHGPSERDVSVTRSKGRARAIAGAAALVVAGSIVALLASGDDGSTRVVTAPPDTTRTAHVVPCGSRLPGPIAEGPRVHDPNELLPETVSVRIYACRVDRPPTLPNGQPMATTLRALIERFGGMEGSVTDEFGKTHAISLAPLAGADPDTTLVGLLWSGTRRDAPPRPAGLPNPPSTAPTLEPPWVTPRFQSPP